MKLPWTELEHRIYKAFSDEQITDKKLLLMVSGGMDSMCLMTMFHRLAAGLKLKLRVLHCHHGDCDDVAQKKFRDQTQELVKNTCEILNIEFSAIQAKELLSSEAEFRDFRKISSQQILSNENCDFSMWAQHENDFIETQMLRLIRGAGSEALAHPMKYIRDKEIRPFLNVSKREIIDYAEKLAVTFIDDPSNSSDAYLRNWMRNTWLPMLEEKQPGALSSLSRSLVLLYDSNEIDLPAEIWITVDQETAMSRRIYGALSASQRRYAIVQAFKMRRIINFSQNHVFEVMKQLDKSEKEHRFRVATLTWMVSKDMILFAANV